MKNRATNYSRIKQPTPRELTDGCLDFLRRKFYQFPGGDKAFFQQRRDLLQRVVLFPAGWLNSRGVTIHGDQYREIFMRVFMQAAAHVQSKVKYPPAYLAQVIESHFRIHGEDYYDQAKSTRNQIEAVMLLVGRPNPVAAAPDPVREMAAAARLIQTPKRKPKSALKPAQNLELKLA